MEANAVQWATFIGGLIELWHHTTPPCVSPLPALPDCNCDCPDAPAYPSLPEDVKCHKDWLDYLPSTLGFLSGPVGYVLGSRRGEVRGRRRQRVVQGSRVTDRERRSSSSSVLEAEILQLPLAPLKNDIGAAKARARSLRQ